MSLLGNVPSLPSKEDLKYFDACLIQLYKDDLGNFICAVREHPQSSQLRGFQDHYSFGAMQQAIGWLKANKRS